MFDCTLSNSKGRGTFSQYLYKYVPPSGVVIVRLLIYNRVSIFETFSKAEYNIGRAHKLQNISSKFKLFIENLLNKICLFDHVFCELTDKQTNKQS